jgi:hypothetical protein
VRGDDGAGDLRTDAALAAGPEDAIEYSLTQLRQRIEHDPPPIPVRGAPLLPFGALGPEVFERLVAEVIALRDDSSVHFYGRRGQKQYGLDIYEEQANGQRVLYQVKRFQGITGSAIREAVLDWAGPRSFGFDSIRDSRRFQAGRFVVVTSALVDDDTEKTDEIAALQREYQGDITIDVWGAEALSHRLRDKPAIVLGLFGEAWASEFCGRDAMREERKRQRRLREAEECLHRAVGAQFATDDKIKFRQIDLVGITVDRLFVDVPVRAESGSPTEALITQIVGRAGTPSTGGGADHERPIAGGIQLLLHPRWDKSAVIVGGPGQGKSTLLQYLCQYYRSRRLAEGRYEPSSIGLAEISSVVRTPIKVDLTKYAEWRRQQLYEQASDRSKNAGRPGRGQRRSLPTLDAYLVHLIGELGEMRFDWRGWHHVVKTQPMLLALDSLDEIADAHEREIVADEVRTTEGRLRGTQADVVVVVATRPGAAGNPIWRDRNFTTLFLQRLTPPLRALYLERWLTTTLLDDEEVVDLRQAFAEGMDQSHVRELAGNPMQLAILLHLMHKVPSLPEKRTELYRSYVDIFMQRESKHPVVRAHQGLIVAFHRVLAWHIHTNVELQRSTGTVTYDELRAVLSAYLAPRGHSAKVIDEIFGSMQRVLCISEHTAGSGEYQFDVQPLREYFASAYLYEVAPHAAEANVQLEILQALIPRQYWTNVLRFFAGELRSGEIPNVGYALDAVSDARLQGLHPLWRIVGRTLLDDQVFVGQHVVVIRDIVAKVLSGPGLQLALDGLLQQDESVITFPTGLASDSVSTLLAETLLGQDHSAAVAAARLLRTLDPTRQMPLATDLLLREDLPALDRLERLAALGAMEQPERELDRKVDRLVASIPPSFVLLDFLLREQAGAGGATLLSRCQREIAEGRVSTAIDDHVLSGSPLGQLVSSARFDRAYSRLGEVLVSRLDDDRGATTQKLERTVRFRDDAPKRRRQRTKRGRPTRPASGLEVIEHAIGRDADWRTAVPWSEWLDLTATFWGVDSWPVREAVMTVPPVLADSLSSGDGSVAAQATWQEVIAWRKYAHENRADPEWWHQQATACDDDIARATFIAFALTTAHTGTVQALIPSCEVLLRSIEQLSVGTIASTLERYARRNPTYTAVRLSEGLRLGKVSPSPCLSALLTQVADDATREQLARRICANPSALWDGSPTTAMAALRALTNTDKMIPWKAFEGARALVPAGALDPERLKIGTRSDAMRILEEPTTWPTDVVRAAVDRLGRDLGKLPPIGEVANLGGWTGVDGDLINVALPSRRTTPDVERPHRQAAPRQPHPRKPR